MLAPSKDPFPGKVAAIIRPQKFLEYVLPARSLQKLGIPLPVPRDYSQG